MKMLPVTPVALVLTAACSGGDPVVGDWELTSLRSGGDVFEFPVELSSHTRTQSLHLDEAGEGEWLLTYSYADGTRTHEVIPLIGTPVERGSWQVLGPEIELTLTCEASRNSMSCRGAADGGLGISMELIRS